jgi:aminoglycoside phosphotransferase (APT) family kinase protein
MSASDNKSLGLPTKDQHRSLDDLRAALQGWMAPRVAGAHDFAITHIGIPSGSGLANETLLLDAQWQADGALVKRGYVVRIEASDPLFPGSSARQQFLMNRALQGTPGVPVPQVLDVEENCTLLGAPFYVMERIDGRVPADDPPFHHRGWVTELEESERRALFVDAVRTMAALHKTDLAQLEFMQPHTVGDGLRENFAYYQREFDGPADGPHPVIDAGREWLLQHFPQQQPAVSLAWGDARVGNMIFAGGECRAVLDWDMVSLAGAETDLAWWCVFDMVYTVSSGIPRLPGFGTPAAMLALWEEYSGRKVQNFDWHLVFAFYKSAVIVRRLARKLKREGRLPADSAAMEFHNPGMQYLASFLNIAAEYPITMPWPGLDK